MSDRTKRENIRRKVKKFKHMNKINFKKKHIRKTKIWIIQVRVEGSRILIVSPLLQKAFFSKRNVYFHFSKPHASSSSSDSSSDSFDLSCFELSSLLFFSFNNKFLPSSICFKSSGSCPPIFSII